MQVRQASGCVVYRRVHRRLQILLVTSGSGKSWVFPKGGIEPDLTAQASAVKEVKEEAGAICEIEHELGTYRFVKKGVLQVVQMYGAQYMHDAMVWEEENKRQREWVDFDEAMRRVDDYLAPFLLDVQSLLEG